MWQTVTGVLIGGAISLATTLYATKLQWKNERRRRVDEQGRTAALELIKLLVEIRDAHAEERRTRGVPVTRQQAMENARRNQVRRDTLEMHVQCIGEANLRKQILEFEAKEYQLYEEYQLAVIHLRDCCGSFLRHEKLPPEPKSLREAYDLIEEDWELTAQRIEELREEKGKQRTERDSPDEE